MEKINMRKLNFNKVGLFDFPDAMVFVRPLGSALSRVYKIPEGYLPAKEKEIEQVLNTLCLRYHNKIWYFDLRDPGVQKEIQDILGLMDVIAILVSLDSSPALSN